MRRGCSVQLPIDDSPFWEECGKPAIEHQAFPGGSHLWWCAEHWDIYQASIPLFRTSGLIVDYKTEDGTSFYPDS